MCYMTLFLSYYSLRKLTNMSNLREKAIEIAKQTSSESAFMCGYDRACQEYEEKLRWVPVEEKLPPLHEDVLLKCESSFIDKGCLIHLSGDNMFSSSSGDLDIVTHWRSFL